MALRRALNGHWALRRRVIPGTIDGVEKDPDAEARRCGFVNAADT